MPADPPFRQLEFSFPLVLLPDPAPVEPPHSAAVASSTRARRSSRQESPPGGIAVFSGIFIQRFVARSLPHEAAQLRCRLASMPDQREYPDQTHHRPDPRSSSASLLFTSQASLLPKKHSPYGTPPFFLLPQGGYTPYTTSPQGRVCLKKWELITSGYGPRIARFLRK